MSLPWMMPETGYDFPYSSNEPATPWAVCFRSRIPRTVPKRTSQEIRHLPAIFGGFAGAVLTLAASPELGSLARACSLPANQAAVATTKTKTGLNCLLGIILKSGSWKERSGTCCAGPAFVRHPSNSLLLWLGELERTEQIRDGRAVGGNVRIVRSRDRVW